MENPLLLVAAAQRGVVDQQGARCKKHLFELSQLSTPTKSEMEPERWTPSRSSSASQSQAESKFLFEGNRHIMKHSSLIDLSLVYSRCHYGKSLTFCRAIEQNFVPLPSSNAHASNA